MQHPQLQRGRALIITGPQACGKSRLARELAITQHKTFHEIDAELLDRANGLNQVMNARVSVVIVEGLPRTATGKANTKHLLTNDQVQFVTPGNAERRMARPPLLIFTTNDSEQAREVAADGRRFDLLDMSAELRDA